MVRFTNNGTLIGRSERIELPPEIEQEWLTIETVAGDVFEIVRPPMSEEREAELMKQVRVTVQKESGE